MVAAEVTLTPTPAREEALVDADTMSNHGHHQRLTTKHLNYESPWQYCFRCVY